MRVEVKDKKLVLGRTVYKQGDVFECRETEARLLVQMKKVSKTNKEVTKAEPTAGSTGISQKPGVPAPKPQLEAAKKAPTPPATNTTPATNTQGTVPMSRNPAENRRTTHIPSAPVRKVEGAQRPNTPANTLAAKKKEELEKRAAAAGGNPVGAMTQQPSEPKKG